MAPRISAEDKFKALITELIARYKSGEKAAYSVKDIQEQNPDLNTTYLRKWVREYASKEVESYLMGIGIISKEEYYDDAFSEITLDQMRGKTFFIFAASERQKIDITTMLLDYGAIITDDLSEQFDFVITNRSYLFKKPEETNRLLIKIIRLLGESISGRFVTCHGLLRDYDSVVRSRVFTSEQRTEMGLLISSQYDEFVADTQTDIANIAFSIDESLIPVYDPGKLYWSLEYFLDWYGASGGEIRAELKDYSTKDSFDRPERIQASFNCFAKVCKQINTPKIKMYICELVAGKVLGNNREVVIASVGYIEDFSGYWALVAKVDQYGELHVLLKKKPILVDNKGATDNDYDIEDFSTEGIPAKLRAFVEDPDSVFEGRGKPGYYYIDCKTGNIPEAAFANDPTIKYIEISDNIDKIGYRAFENCTELEAVYIGRSVTSIGPDAFAGCGKLKQIIIPASVKEMSARCFKNCIQLEEVSFGELSMCEYIGNGNFSGCAKLKKITIPELVSTISYQAFENCVSLKSINFPDALRTIERHAFAGCSALREIITSERPYFYKIEDDVFMDCPQLKRDNGKVLIAGYYFN